MRPTVAELQDRYANVVIEDRAPQSPRERVASVVYSLWTKFGRREITKRDYLASGCYLGVDGDRAWRFMLSALRRFDVPHEVEPGADGCNVLRLTQESWCWQAIEGGLVCAACGELFRPSPAQVGLAWSRNPVRCGGCL